MTKGKRAAIKNKIFEALDGISLSLSISLRPSATG